MNLPMLVGCAAATLCVHVAGHAWRAARAELWRDQKWFAGAALSAALIIVLQLKSLFLMPPAVRLGLTQLELAFVAVHLACWVGFAARVLDAPLNRVDRAIWVGLGIAWTASLVPGLIFSDPAAVRHFTGWTADRYVLQLGHGARLLGVLALLAFARPLVRFTVGARRNREARWYAVGLWALALIVVLNVLANFGALSTPVLLGAGIVLPIVVAAVVQNERLVQTARDLDARAARLEGDVHQRSMALVQAREALAKSERLAAIGQLAAGVAHEVNNPAAALQGNLQYLLESLGEGAEPDRAELRACLEESHQAVKRIGKIVQQLRDSARAAASPLHAESIGVSAAVSAAVASARSELPHGPDAVEVPEELFAAGVQGYLVQVLTNLLVNAAQAANPGEPPRVSVRARREGPQVRIEVIDQGAGMSAEVQRRLFEPFFTTKPVGRGTGLGLAVSRGLVQRMGGELHLASAPGKGTTVAVVLAAAEAEPRAHATAPAQGARQRQRLLLIDDDPLVRRALSRQLASRFELEFAEGVNDGLPHAMREPAPDLVLCDVVMADGGGPRFYQLLAAAQPALARRLVFLTGGAISADHRRFLEEQPQPVLAKPLELAALLDAAARLPRSA